MSAGFTLHIDTSALMATARNIKRAEKVVPIAIWRGMLDGSRKVTTVVKRALKEQSGAKKLKTVTERVTVMPSASALRYVIAVSGKTTDIKDFGAKKTGKGINASPWNNPRLFKRSFYLEGMYMARTTSKRFPIRTLHGPNLAKEAMTGVVPGRFELTVRYEIPPKILARVAAALGSGKA